MIFIFIIIFIRIFLTSKYVFGFIPDELTLSTFYCLSSAYIDYTSEYYIHLSTNLNIYMSKFKLTPLQYFILLE